MPPPRFEPIPETFWRELPAKHDRIAVGSLNVLNNCFQYAQPQSHGYSSWGYTVLRTVYTPESDALFPVAMERLKRLIRYWCHYTRFQAYGAYCEESKIDYAEPNEELFRRCFLDVVEDREGLAHLDSGSDNSPDRFTALADYFRQWLAGIDTGNSLNIDPRFSSCLAIDSESLALLAAIPDELPVLQCPATRKDKADTLGTGYPAWLWLIEARYMAQPARHRGPYPGWLRLEPRDILTTWDDHWSVNNSHRRFCLGHEETPQGSGIYYYNRERWLCIEDEETPDGSGDYYFN